MRLVVHNDLQLRPECLPEFRALIDPDSTRAYPGCHSFVILEDLHAPGHIVFIQEWDSRQALDQYRAFRQAEGSRATLRALYARPAVTTYCTYYEERTTSATSCENGAQT
jgi:quinol monooxygenase YgiN